MTLNLKLIAKGYNHMTYSIRLPTFAPAIAIVACLTILLAVGPGEAAAQVIYGSNQAYYNGYGAGYNNGYGSAFGNYGASRLGYGSYGYSAYGLGPYGYRTAAPYGYSTSSGYGYSSGTYNSLYNRSLRLRGGNYGSVYNPTARYYSPYGNWAY